MRAGRLRHRVQVQSLVVSQDGYGEPVETWGTAATVWAEMTPSLRATREAFATVSEQRSARTTYQCRLRHPVPGLGAGGLTPKETRVVWQGRVFEVESVMDPDGRGCERVLLCYVRE